MRTETDRARLSWVLAGLRLCLAFWLARGALVFLRHGQSVFAHLGRPDAARLAIAFVELAGAVFFLFARTAVAGGLVLSLLLAWVAGLHFAAGWDARMLYVFLLAVLALAAATRVRTAGKQA